MIVRGNRELTAHYHRLGAGDVFVGRVVAGPLRSALLIDLMSRGVHCLPSPLSQCLNGSKIAQVQVLGEWMMPLTRVVRRRAELLEILNLYQREGVGAVVTKQEHMHCGHGLRRWENIEMLYNMVSYRETDYPFVLQPFLSGFTDIRAIVVGDYVEAYTRFNPDNFRMNLAAGGSSRPCRLNPEQEAFCREVMQRGRFPFAHLDLHLLEDGRHYLSEITLGGGVKGARIERAELERRKSEILEKLAADLEISSLRPNPGDREER